MDAASSLTLLDYAVHVGSHSILNMLINFGYGKLGFGILRADFRVVAL